MFTPFGDYKRDITGLSFKRSPHGLLVREENNKYTQTVITYPEAGNHGYSQVRKTVTFKFIEKR